MIYTHARLTYLRLMIVTISCTRDLYFNQFYFPKPPNVYVSVCTQIYIHTCLYVYLRICVCMYICICICVYVYIQTYIYRHVRLQTHTHPCIIVSPAVQVPLRKSAQFMMAQAVPVLLQLDEYTKVDSNTYKSWVNDATSQ